MHFSGKGGKCKQKSACKSEQLIKAGWRKCNAPEAPSAKEFEMVLLFQLGGAVQKCRGHVLSFRWVSRWRVLAGSRVSPPFPGAPAPMLLCWVLILLLRSAAPLLIAPIPTPSPWAAGGFNIPNLAKTLPKSS